MLKLYKNKKPIKECFLKIEENEGGVEAFIVNSGGVPVSGGKVFILKYDGELLLYGLIHEDRAQEAGIKLDGDCYLKVIKD